MIVSGSLESNAQPGMAGSEDDSAPSAAAPWDSIAGRPGDDQDSGLFGVAEPGTIPVLITRGA